MQAGSPLLQNFGKSTCKSNCQQTSQQPGCDKFSHLFAVLGVVVATLKDKEQENSPLVSECKNLTATSSNRERTLDGRFTKASKGTNKKLDQMREGYKNFVAKRKLELENFTDESEPPSEVCKRQTRSSEVCAITFIYVANVFVFRWIDYRNCHSC